MKIMKKITAFFLIAILLVCNINVVKASDTSSIVKFYVHLRKGNDSYKAHSWRVTYLNEDGKTHRAYIMDGDITDVKTVQGSEFTIDQIYLTDGTYLENVSITKIADGKDVYVDLASYIPKKQYSVSIQFVANYECYGMWQKHQYPVKIKKVCAYYTDGSSYFSNKKNTTEIKLVVDEGSSIELQNCYLFNDCCAFGVERYENITQDSTYVIDVSNKVNGSDSIKNN